MSNPNPTGTTLSEQASKQLVQQYGVPTATERQAGDPDGAVHAAREVGFPVVLKLNGDNIVLEHPSGVFEAAVEARVEPGSMILERAGIVRTARKIMDGTVFPRDGAHG